MVYNKAKKNEKNIQSNESGASVNDGGAINRPCTAIARTIT